MTSTDDPYGYGRWHALRATVARLEHRTAQDNDILVACTLAIDGTDAEQAIGRATLTRLTQLVARLEGVAMSHGSYPTVFA
jgi:hypothetical protein